MGQQETMVVVAEEEKGGGTLFRRMILVLLVATLMAAMMAASAMPAMAVVLPEQPTKGKPTSAGDISNHPGKGPDGTGSPGASVNLQPLECTGAKPLVWGHAGGDGQGGHCN